jgi:hypothetical protein
MILIKVRQARKEKSRAVKEKICNKKFSWGINLLINKVKRRTKKLAKGRIKRFAGLASCSVPHG